MPIIFLKYCIGKLISTGAGISWMIVYLRYNEEPIDLHVVIGFIIRRVLRRKTCGGEKSSSEEVRL
jgi:hypothetical protein